MLDHKVDAFIAMNINISNIDDACDKSSANSDGILSQWSSVPGM
jgi:hypothetical protein